MKIDSFYVYYIITHPLSVSLRNPFDALFKIYSSCLSLSPLISFHQSREIQPATYTETDGEEHEKKMSVAS